MRAVPDRFAKVCLARDDVDRRNDFPGALGIGVDSIEVVTPDTSVVPNSGPTVASRTCMIVGKLVESACLQIRQTLMQNGLLQEGYSAEDFKQACGEYVQRHGTFKCQSQYATPPGIYWDDDKYQGDAYATYAWAVYVAEVSVDTRTCETRVEDFVAVQEVGRVINPILAKGQIEGGVAQGIGYALYEDVAWREGRMIELGTPLRQISGIAVHEENRNSAAFASIIDVQPTSRSSDE